MTSDLQAFDTHAHLDFPELLRDIEGVLERARHAGVSRILSVGSGRRGLESAFQAVELSERYDLVMASVGVHPEYAMNPDQFIDQLTTLALHRKVVAIGETGLDFTENAPAREIQNLAFEVQIQLAKECKKPLIIHSRGATLEALGMLTSRGMHSGVFHCFVEDFSIARKVLDQGFSLSFTGIVTFKNAHLVRECALQVPIESMLLETDAPFLAPVPYRGKQNEPSYVIEVARCIAQIKDISLETMVSATTLNAERLFKL
jgi:TatD DNase family protein